MLEEDGAAGAVSATLRRQARSPDAAEFDAAWAADAEGPDAHAYPSRPGRWWSCPGAVCCRATAGVDPRGAAAAEQAVPPGDGRLGRLLVAAGEADEAMQHALAATAVDPLREEGHREVIRLYLALGHPDAARRRPRRPREALRRCPGQPYLGRDAGAAGRRGPSRRARVHSTAYGPAQRDAPRPGASGGVRRRRRHWTRASTSGGRRMSSSGQPCSAGTASSCSRAPPGGERPGRRSTPRPARRPPAAGPAHGRHWGGRRLPKCRLLSSLTSW